MKLSEALHQFEIENGHKATLQDYPKIATKYGPQEPTPEFKNATEALLHCLQSFKTEGDGAQCENNPEYNKRYEEITKELGIDPNTTNIQKSNKIANLIVIRHPEIFNLNNIREQMLVKLVNIE